MKSKRFWTTFFLIFDAWNTIYDCESSRILSSWWRHQMETLSALLVLCVGNSPVTGEFPSQKPLTRSFDIFFDLRLKNRWANKRGAGDLRRHRAHYDVIEMFRLMDGNTLRPGRNKRHFAYDVSNAFSWMKIFEFWWKFHWNLFPRVQLTIFQHGFR